MSEQTIPKRYPDVGVAVFFAFSTLAEWCLQVHVPPVDLADALPSAEEAAAEDAERDIHAV